MENIKTLITDSLKDLPFKEKVDFINSIREHIHNESPFKNEPVDFVKWIVSDDVIANDYNPNKVAPPEMELLEISILNDGYTQPIVTWENKSKDKIEVIDGFHRHRVGKESKIINAKINGYLPTVIIRKEQESKNDRIASTIRHNRARGYTKIPDEVDLELENKCWAPSWRRMCKVLLRNDYWCKGLGQTQPKSDAYQAFKEIKAKRKIEALF